MGGKKISCAVCKTYCGTFKNLLVHASLEHNIKLNQQNLTFTSLSDYESWLENEEKKGLCKFSCYDTKLNTKTLICHRSGYSTILGVENRKRQAKTTGSCKINGFCTAHIKIKEINDEIHVDYCATHFGHELQLGLLPLSRTEKRSIAVKLQQGVSVKKILSDANYREAHQKVQRLHLTNRKDIQNICHQFGVRPKGNSTLHKEDVVDQLSLLRYNEDKLNMKLSESFRGRSTKKTAKVLPRHQDGLLIKKNVHAKTVKKLIFENGKVVMKKINEWKIEEFNVRENDHYHCTHSCGIRCNDCGLCYLSYTCQCMDYVIKRNICKHIHAVACSRRSRLPGTTNQTMPITVESVSTSHNSSKWELTQNRLLMDIARINEDYSLYSPRILDAIMEHMKEINNLADVKTDRFIQSGSTILREPANKGEIKQKSIIKRNNYRNKKTVLIGPQNCSGTKTAKQLIIEVQTLDVIYQAEHDHNYVQHKVT